ncbi:MAG: lactoylglutathione lyase [Thermoleophilia bacterium]|nr:lactoylglutathione lyase [Thermoleophilia bacterium]
MNTFDAITEYDIACDHDRHGRENDAVPRYERALTLGLVGEERRGAMLGLGSTLRNVGRVDDSVALLREAVQEFPDYPPLKVFLALSLNTQGRTGEALAVALDVAMLDEQVQEFELALTRYRDDVARRTAHFKHVSYRVGDIDRSLAFYAALGFQERRRYHITESETKVMIGLPRDGEFLGLTFVEDVSSYDLGTGYNHIAITVESMENTLAALAAHDGEIEQEPFRVRKGGSLIAFVSDPDGYRVELIERS